MRPSVRTKILGTSGVLLAFMAVIGGMSVVNLGSVDRLGASMYADRALPLEQLGTASREFLNVRRAVTAELAYVGNADKITTAEQRIAASEDTIKQRMDACAATYLPLTEEQVLESLRRFAPEFVDLVERASSPDRDPTG